ncbi:MAG: hydrogenase small subunit [Magnetococcales bacterium]|nr:hydrogenase small subunit [Magnetococcales bacterium]MBF0155735.1 hydrogenase small subunit [Magnetococcales bacterium]
MAIMNRRDFLRLGSLLALSMGLGESLAPRLAEALEELTLGQNPILWLQSQACSGCSVSFLNSDDPGPAELLTTYINLLFHSTVSTATGDLAAQVVNGTIKKGGYYLVAEGALPATMEEACIFAGEPMTKLVTEAARKAKAVITVGSCASWGGVPAAENNPTGATSVPDYLEKQGVHPTLIRLPGCPVHPDWVVGTLAHVLGFGLPELDHFKRPLMFYGKTVHDQCPRFAYHEREQFARSFAEEGCLFELGCVGPRCFADCPQRLWNSRTNFCIRAGAPCIGCANEDFARLANFPFYPKGMDFSQRREIVLPKGFK